MSLVEYAKSELERGGWLKPDAEDGVYDGMLGAAVMKLIELFADEGHTGQSAPIAIALFTRLASFEPLSPLTGDNDEWMEVREGHFQNRRCSRVFKNGDEVYDIDGFVFEAPDGSRYTNLKSHRAVTFPYTPKTEIVKVDE
jgi:hypothetical protein